MGVRVLDAQLLVPAPPGADVLTPSARGTLPTLRIGLHFGINRSNYTNDRYLNNVPFDVGDVSGEAEIYSSATAFGYTGGINAEYPLNSSMSLVGWLQYEHVRFAATGSVSEPCLRRDSVRMIGTSIHSFEATLNYLALAGAVKIDFTSWYFLVGLRAAHPLSTTLDRTRTLPSTDCFFPDTDWNNHIEEHGTVPNPGRIHYAFRLGGGLTYPLSDRLTFAPELTFDFGMSAINKSPNSDLGIYSLMATLRYDLR